MNHDEAKELISLEKEECKILVEERGQCVLMRALTLLLLHLLSPFIGISIDVLL
jgi:hypothetical protein